MWLGGEAAGGGRYGGDLSPRMGGSGIKIGEANFYVARGACPHLKYYFYYLTLTLMLTLMTGKLI
jgi:hypothetical protein